ncbi:hypothetical protein DUNSADRAFT_12960 [Dunaliella salina]|uniref:Encoded protein n=1 Tax=Dunaliella salina TaxID=3046 RepID=A0ABQ7GAB8_DUNSA|nr:hypothetical protein DUNSADRAFT_12960 [Dunaliella salina]|eukprot:KAF5831547.1 hypothetical protein DUNSADRAFT_12960 [Dunaliella salina]
MTHPHEASSQTHLLFPHPLFPRKLTHSFLTKPTHSSQLITRHWVLITLLVTLCTVALRLSGSACISRLGSCSGSFFTARLRLRQLLYVIATAIAASLAAVRRASLEQGTTQVGGHTTCKRR